MADKISLRSDTATFEVSPTGAGVANGKVTAIRVLDIAKQVWYNWGNQVADGWDTSDWTGTEGQKNLKGSPVCSQGTNNLYIAFWVVNEGETGDIKLSIKDDKGMLATKTYLVSAGEGLGVEWTGDMPSGSYAIILEVLPDDVKEFTIKPTGWVLPIPWWQIVLIALAAIGGGAAIGHALKRKKSPKKWQ